MDSDQKAVSSHRDRSGHSPLPLFWPSCARIDPACPVRDRPFFPDSEILQAMYGDREAASPSVN